MSGQEVMKPTRLAALFALLCLCAPHARAQNADARRAAAPPDVPALIAAAQRNGEALSRRMFEYSWRSQTLIRHMNKRGRVVRESAQGHEVYPLPGRAFVVQKLVTENGQPLPAKRAAKEDRRVKAELAHAELLAATFADAFTATEQVTGCPAFGIWTVLNAPGGAPTSFGISDFLCFGEFSAPRVEQREGREMVVLSFRPRADFTPPAPEKSPFARLVGLVWVDSADKVVARVEAWLVDDPRRADPRTLRAEDAAVVFEDARLTAGMWVRRSRYVNTSRNPAAFNGLNLEWRQEFADYTRYHAEFKQYNFDAPPKSPPSQETPRQP